MAHINATLNVTDSAFPFSAGNKFNDYFMINNKTGEITVAKPIDRESEDVRAVNGFIELNVKVSEREISERIKRKKRMILGGRVYVRRKCVLCN